MRVAYQGATAATWSYLKDGLMGDGGEAVTSLTVVTDSQED